MSVSSENLAKAVNQEESSEIAEQPRPIFRDLNPDDPDPETTVIESVCLQCFRTGITRLLLTKIPFYKEVIVMSFKCQHCGATNNEIQSASEIQEKGVRIELNVTSTKDLNRRVVRSDNTSVIIPEVELEIPAQTQKGEITTIEGVIDRTVRGLTQDQDKRRIEHPDAAASIDAYIQRLNDLKDLKTKFSVVIEDISGNSFIENPDAPAVDAKCKTIHFERTKEQNKMLGFYNSEDVGQDNENQEATAEAAAAAAGAEAAAAGAEAAAKSIKNKPKSSDDKNLLKPIPEGSWPIEELHNEVLQFHTQCPECQSHCQTNMKLTNIPHFKEVVIMATVCDACGCKTNEVKSGGGIEAQGVRFEVDIKDATDLTRDVLKSETCSLSIPELECEVGSSALGGRFTTVEGILVAMKEQIEVKSFMFQDSADEALKMRVNEFLAKFDKLLNNEFEAKLILDDPAGNSYVQSLSDDDNATDDKLKCIKYERDFEQNEELGLNDIKTENYENDDN